VTGTGRLARATAIAVLVLAMCSTAGYVTVASAMKGRIPEGTIVVVGDPSAPSMADALTDLRARVAGGDSLTETTGGLSVGAGVVILFLLVWVGVGAFIVWRQPGNWAGWLLIIVGAPLPLQALAQDLVVYELKVAPGSVPFVGLLAMIGEFALYPIALLPLLFLLYPNGHLPSPRWRWAAIGLGGGTGVTLLAFLLRPGPFNNWRGDGILYENPIGVEGFTFGGSVIAAGTVVALASALSTVVAVWRRFRRSAGEERQQMRILAFVAALAGTFIALWILTIVFTVAEEGAQGGDSRPIELLFALTALTIIFGVPIAYLVAILRYRLWDLDVVIRKTVVAAVLAGFIGLVYAAIVAGPGVLMGTGSNPGLTFVAAAVLAIAFQPARDRARRVADRLVYGKRATPYEVLTEFAGRVGGAFATEDVLGRMAQVLAEGTGADSATIWLGGPTDRRAAMTWPRHERDPVTVPDDAVDVLHQGEPLGALSVVMPASDPMSPAKTRLVVDLAAQAGPVLRNVQLVEELRASRQRIVVAQDDERRKLERNIHDGAQQQLVALTVKLRLLGQLAGRDASKAEELAGQLQAEATDALENLRDLARGIYPPLLADQGLGAALEAQARKAAVPTTVETDGIGRYSQDVEATVYFSVLEALQNVAKYADASSATVRLAHTEGHLTFSVTDDGHGFDPAATGYGTGLQGIADRLAAVGGTVDVMSAPGSGTTVGGRVEVQVG
jgi:signal transduction histidine kinase